MINWKYWIIGGLFGVAIDFCEGKAAEEHNEAMQQQDFFIFSSELLPPEVEYHILSFVDLPICRALTTTSRHFCTWIQEFLPRAYLKHYAPQEFAAQDNQDIVKELCKVVRYIPSHWVEAAFYLMKDPTNSQTRKEPRSSFYTYTEEPKDPVDELMKDLSVDQDYVNKWGGYKKLRYSILPHCSLEERAHGVVAMIHHVGFEQMGYLKESNFYPFGKNILSLPVDVMVASNALYEDTIDSLMNNKLKTREDIVTFRRWIRDEDQITFDEIVESLEFKPEGEIIIGEASSETWKNYTKIHKFFEEAPEYSWYLPQAPFCAVLAQLSVPQIEAFLKGIRRRSLGRYSNPLSVLKACYSFEPEIIVQLCGLIHDTQFQEETCSSARDIRVEEDIGHLFDFFREFKILGQFPKSHHALMLTLWSDYGQLKTCKHLYEKFASIPAESLQAFLDMSQSWPDKRDQKVYTLADILRDLPPDHIRCANRLLKTDDNGYGYFLSIEKFILNWTLEEIIWVDRLFDITVWNKYARGKAMEKFSALDSSRRKYLLQLETDALWYACHHPVFALSILKKAPDEYFVPYFKIMCKMICLIEAARDYKGSLFLIEEYVLKMLQEISHDDVEEWCEAYLDYGDYLFTGLNSLFDYVSHSPSYLRTWGIAKKYSPFGRM